MRTRASCELAGLGLAALGAMFALGCGASEPAAPAFNAPAAGDAAPADAPSHDPPASDQRPPAEHDHAAGEAHTTEPAPPTEPDSPSVGDATPAEPDAPDEPATDTPEPEEGPSFPALNPPRTNPPQ